MGRIAIIARDTYIQSAWHRGLGLSFRHVDHTMYSGDRSVFAFFNVKVDEILTAVFTTLGIGRLQKCQFAFSVVPLFS